MTAEASIVLPSTGRASLRGVVAALAAQELDGAACELVVAANGPGSRQRVAAMLEGFPWPARVVERRAPGIGAARNAALQAAEGRLAVLINDDIVPAGSRWLRGHLDAQAAAGDAPVAVLGPVAWAPDPPPTRVMRWMADEGMMNRYDDVARGAVSPANFYASNVSVPRALVLDAGGFDERLDGYGWEEYDLSLRLHDRGLRVRWAPELLVHHHHVYTLGDSLSRMEAIGRASRRFNAMHAERDGLVTPHPSPLKVAVGRTIAPIATRLPVSDRLPEGLARRLLWVSHQAALARGFAERGS